MKDDKSWVTGLREQIFLSHVVGTSHHRSQAPDEAGPDNEPTLHSDISRPELDIPGFHKGSYKRADI
jgi:hypothetical protein